MIVKCEYCGEEYDLSENGGVCPYCGGSYTSDNNNDNRDRDDDNVPNALMSFDESGIDKRVLGIEYDYVDNGVINEDSEIVVYYKKEYAHISNGATVTLRYHIDFTDSFIIVDFPNSYGCGRFIIVADNKTINYDTDNRRWEGLTKDELKTICDAKDLTFKYSKDGILHAYKDDKGEFRLLAQVFYHTFIDKSQYKTAINQLVGRNQITEVSHGLNKTFYVILVIAVICALLFFILK